MYFSSPSSTRLALGPGRAVLILGPMVAVIILVVIGILLFRWWPLVSGQVSVNGSLGAQRPGSDAIRPGRFRRMRKLIATEERGTQPRRKIGPIAPRTHQPVQPALGGLGVRKTRIGIPVQHRFRATSTLIIAASNDLTEPQSNHHQLSRRRARASRLISCSARS